jgi:hypothetical protein
MGDRSRLRNLKIMTMFPQQFRGMSTLHCEFHHLHLLDGEPGRFRQVVSELALCC